MTEFFTVSSCIASLLFVGLVAYAHLKRREFDHASTSLSEYFSGSTRHVMLAAYICMAFALVCLALKIIPEQRGIVGGMGKVCGLLMLIAAACLIPIALTARRQLDADTRSARTKSLHRVLACVSLVAMVIAMVAYSMLGFPTDHRYQRALRAFAIVWSMFALMALVISIQVPPGTRYHGLVQKILVAMVATWVFICAWA